MSAQGQSAELLNTENSIEKFQTENGNWENVESDKDGTQKRNVNETEKTEQQK